MDPNTRERMDTFLKEEGFRRTTQRDAIVEAAFSTKDHYTAEDLLTMARQLDRSVSRATVYRTLPILVKSGMLREMDFGRDFKYYDPNYVDHPHHNHLICVDCEKIIEFEDIGISTMEDCISKRLGFSPQAKMIRIEAHCDEWKRAGSCRNRLAAQAV